MSHQNGKVKIGFIGMGNIARIHIANLMQIEDASVTAICDVEVQRAQEAAQRVGAAAYTDWREMLDAEPLDAVLVCIPQFARGEEVKAAAEKGVALFIEKPAAPQVALAKENAEAIRRAGVINAIGYMWRSSSCIDKMKTLIAGREVGLIHGYSVSTAPFGTWFWDKKRSGGQIFDQTTHIIDLSRIFGGEVSSVTAIGTTGRIISEEWVKSEDVSGLLLKYRNGTVGTFANTWAYEAESPGLFSLSVFGRQFGLHFEPFENRLTGAVDGVRVDYEGPEETRMQELVNFVRAVKTGEQEHIKCAYGEGVGTLEVTLGANQSMEEKREIAL